jgi:sugar/nucleoside kinase (ribokinase family)
VVDSGGTRSCLPVPTVAAVDTLGAGDVLHGAIAHNLAADRTVDPVEAIRQAIPIAARSCAHRGVTTWARGSAQEPVGADRIATDSGECREGGWIGAQRLW